MGAHINYISKNFSARRPRTCTGMMYFKTHLLIKILGMPRLARKHPYMYRCVCTGAIDASQMNQTVLICLDYYLGCIPFDNFFNFLNFFWL